jgi:hypothetical protein
MDAQTELRRAYVGGGPGVAVSSFIWLIAGLVTQTKGIGPGFTVLFFGGMLIYPLSKMLVRTFFSEPNESKTNPLRIIALESTIAMIGTLLASWLLLKFDPSLVFPVAAIAVGTHYFAFRSVYGDRMFTLLAAVITALGALEIFGSGQMGNAMIFAVAAVEAAFGAILVVRARREARA